MPTCTNAQVSEMRGRFKAIREHAETAIEEHVGGNQALGDLMDDIVDWAQGGEDEAAVICPTCNPSDPPF